EDDGVLAALEHDVEVAAAHRLLRPPPVDDPPLLAHERDRLPVDARRLATEARLHERRLRLVDPSRGTGGPDPWAERLTRHAERAARAPRGSATTARPRRQ